MSLLPEPLRIPAFRAYWLARLTTTIAQMAMVIVIGWQVYDIARETMDIRDAAFQLGLIGLVQFVPLFVLTPVSGWAADRFDRRIIARAVVAARTAVRADPVRRRPGADRISLPILFGVAALLGVARAFAGPALGALAPNLVPRELLPKAIALSSIAWQAGAIAGPALGGILYDVTPHLPYGVSAALFAFSAVCLFTIGPVPRTAHRARQARSSRWSTASPTSAATGWCSARSRSTCSRCCSAGSTAMLPVYARDILQVGAAGPRAAARRAGGRRDADRDLLLVPAAQDQCRRQDAGRGRRVRRGDRRVRLFDAPMPLSLAMLALLGAADMFSVYIRQSLIQLHTPDEMRGRVAAASTLAISASNELGETRSGFAAALLGPVTATVAGGIAAVAVTLLWACWFPELRRARTFELADEPPPEEATVIAGGA